jgi:hypothetical protein
MTLAVVSSRALGGMEARVAGQLANGLPSFTNLVCQLHSVH